MLEYEAREPSLAMLVTATAPGHPAGKSMVRLCSFPAAATTTAVREAAATAWHSAWSAPIPASDRLITWAPTDTA